MKSISNLVGILIFDLDYATRRYGARFAGATGACTVALGSALVSFVVWSAEAGADPSDGVHLWFIHPI